MKTKNTTTLHLRKSSGQSPLRGGLPRVQPIWIIRGFLLIPLMLACFALSPTARAVTPAPDGGYSNKNTAEGTNALFSLTTGSDNTATGFEALYHNKTGENNTATGGDALFSNTSGYNNTANGDEALLSNTTGYNNTATGVSALGINTKGRENTAMGFQALYFNNGSNNTATGVDALLGNATGNNNTANGYEALNGGLMTLATGSNNTGTGYRALYSYTTGHDNVANGVNALLNNSTGNYNTANGRGALNKNSTASNNTADGYQALNNNGTGSGNIALGYQAGLNLTTGNSNIDIGNVGVVGEASTIRIGTVGTQTATFVAGIYNVNEGGTIKAVYINSNGQLGTQAPASSRRFKKEIKPMDQTSEAVLALKPVTFQYKSDPAGAGPQFGLIAEEVAKVNPDLVVRDEKGEIYTVRYEAVNAMLLNEFLKEHQKVQEQQATIAQLKCRVAKQEEGMEALAAHMRDQDSKIQRVSDRLELRKSAPKVVVNKP